ncbi:excisionase family DNA-binding protein [Jatrophihabitans sp. GAS493]|uniref:excisionase family DNA-binding protein n=1 Tax=Jatrophihabitans sp. GAS493 TaxID=1907575 RepID=UPI001A7E077E|nr:excisionase family DNA-binding protein [Jatrophihabitans sp. GAS493]
MAHASDLPEELWDIDRLADYLGCGRRLVYRLTHEHRIRFVRVGRELRFDPRDVAVYLSSVSVEVSEPEPAVMPAPIRRGRPRATDVRRMAS